MAILVEDILALACLLLQPTWPLLALASLATTVALTSSEKLPERTGGETWWSFLNAFIYTRTPSSVLFQPTWRV